MNVSSREPKNEEPLRLRIKSKGFSLNAQTTLRGKHCGRRCCGFLPELYCTGIYMDHIVS